MFVISKLRFIAQISCLVATIVGHAGASAADVKFPSYLIDILVDSCMARMSSGSHAVYAFSPIEVGFCSYGVANIPSHRKVALEGCSRQIPANLRSSIKCSIVVEDGKVVNQKLMSSQHREISAPAEIEIFDGKTGKTENFTGFVSTGRYASMTHRIAWIALSNGKLLCEGFRVERSTGMSYQGKCFGKFEFKGNLPVPSGFFLYDGNYVVKTSFTMKSGKSYIKVTTR
jgi:hypothetical protein